MSISRNSGGNVNRLEAFSDAVFAFAATLLVVSLEVPTTFAELKHDLLGFAAFGICFAVLVLLWTVHNAFFRRYGLNDRATVAINSLFLFVVLYYVYPLKFLVESTVGAAFDSSRAPGIGTLDELSDLFVLYGAGFTAVFACVAALYRHARRRAAGLGLGPLEAHEAAVLSRHYAIFVAVGLVSIVLAWSGIGVGYGLPGFVYALLGPLCFAHGWWSERKVPASGAERQSQSKP